MINIEAVKEEFKNDDCKIVSTDNFVILYYEGEPIIDFNKSDEYFYSYNIDKDVLMKVLKNKWFERFYNVINEHREKVLYYVRVFDGFRGYLNYDMDKKEYIVHTRNATNVFVTSFTKDEIEEMKTDEHIAIDWDKVKLIKANGD